MLGPIQKDGKCHADHDEDRRGNSAQVREFTAALGGAARGRLFRLRGRAALSPGDRGITLLAQARGRLARGQARVRRGDQAGVGDRLTPCGWTRDRGHLVKGLQQLGRVLMPVRGPLRQHLVQHFRQLLGNARVQVADVGRFRLHVLVQPLRQAALGERRVAGQHVIPRTTQRIDVTADVGRAARCPGPARGRCNRRCRPSCRRA